MMAKVLFIVAKSNFRDEELRIPKEIIEKRYVVEIASLRRGIATGLLGMKVNVDISLEEALRKIDEYGAVVFVGGPGAQEYYKDERALSIARNAFNFGKIVAAICIAPGILANSGILKGKKSTIWNGKFTDVLKKNGAIYINKSVVVDGRIITANGPEAAKEFGEVILRMLE